MWHSVDDRLQDLEALDCLDVSSHGLGSRDRALAPLAPVLFALELDVGVAGHDRQPVAETPAWLTWTFHRLQQNTLHEVVRVVLVGDEAAGQRT